MGDAEEARDVMDEEIDGGETSTLSLLDATWSRASNLRGTTQTPSTEDRLSLEPLL
jgi:hypothetical protein